MIGATGTEISSGTHHTIRNQFWSSTDQKLYSSWNRNGPVGVIAVSSLAHLCQASPIEDSSTKISILILPYCFLAGPFGPVLPRLKIRRDHEKKFSMRSASMSRQTIRAYLRLYLKISVKHISRGKGLINVISYY